MALIKCPECEGQVSASATLCPHCGFSLKKNGRKTGGCLGVSIICALGIVAILVMASGEHKDVGDGGDRVDKTSNLCQKNWEKCADNADLINNFVDNNLSVKSDIMNDCTNGAEKLTKYGTPKWSWIKFGKFKSGDDFPKTGVIFIVDDEAMFQNEFGAYKHVMVNCEYDLRNSQLLNVEVIDK
jgi:hypothetical protein